jgi:hypothetical protein
MRLPQGGTNLASNGMKIMKFCSAGFCMKIDEIRNRTLFGPRRLDLCDFER